MKNIEFVNMDTPSTTQETSPTLSAKERKAAYMREYYKRKQADNKASATNPNVTVNGSMMSIGHRKEPVESPSSLSTQTQEDRTMTAKEKKAAYMREYHKRRQANKKAALEAKITGTLEEIGRVARKVYAKNNSTQTLVKKTVQHTADKLVEERINQQVSSIAKDRLVNGSDATYHGGQSNVVDFSRAVRLKDPETIKLWMLSQAIDSLVVQAVGDGLKPTDIAGVVANRLRAICEATGSDVLDKIKEKML